MDELVSGRRFSQNYLRPERPVADSVRFRRRLWRAYANIDTTRGIAFAAEFERRTGAKIPRSSGYPLWERFFETADRRDILDLVTVLYVFLANERRKLAATQWLREVGEIVEEEAIGLSVDSSGGVHFAIDEEFEANRSAALAGLGASRYAAARAEFEAAFQALDRDPADGPEAVRRVFAALEVVFRLLLGKRVTRLGASEIDKVFKPVAASFERGEAAVAASKLTASALSDWVNAVHQFRHQKGTEAPTEASSDLMVTLVATGTGLLRWLVALDARVSSKPADA